MKPVQTKVEVITPATAEEYLKRNEQNRNIRERHVTRLASEMAAGRWMFTHQGIAFDEKGALIDGQHRLHAVVKSGTSVRMLVTRGVQQKVNGNVNLFTMDVIDCGRARTTSDQLALLHGVKYSNNANAACRMIAAACMGGQYLPACSVGQAVQILVIYGKTIEEIISLGTNSKLLKNAAVLAALTLGHAVDKELAAEFALGIATGENISRGNPIYALREAMIKRPHSYNAWQGRVQLMQMAANAFYNAIKGSSLMLAKSGALGLNYLVSKQRGNAEKVRSIIG